MAIASKDTDSKPDFPSISFKLFPVKKIEVIQLRAFIKAS